MSGASLFIGATMRHTAFRALMAGGGIYFIGNALQAMTTIGFSKESFPWCKTRGRGSVAGARRSKGNVPA
jgi:hypothetical protein